MSLHRGVSRVWPGLGLAIPTCHRNTQLATVIKSVCLQSTIPEYLLVFDNSIEGVAKGVDFTRLEQLGVSVRYFHSGQNIGPAGAFAAAVNYASDTNPDIKWIMCRGDDNPFVSQEEIEQLRKLSTKCDADVACIGTHGHVIDVRSFRTRSQDISAYRQELIEVNLIPGLGTPTYRVATLMALGVNFDPALFFGWEEMDIGLRICAAGGKLVTSTALDRELRVRLDIPLDGSRDIKVARQPQSWRTYFDVRNRMKIALKHRRARWIFVHAAATTRTCLGAIIRRRSTAEATARLLGIIDGTFGGNRFRRRYVPQASGQIFSDP